MPRPDRIINAREAIDGQGLQRNQSHCGFEDRKVSGRGDDSEKDEECVGARRSVDDIEVNHERPGGGYTPARRHSATPAGRRNGATIMEVIAMM